MINVVNFIVNNDAIFIVKNYAICYFVVLVIFFYENTEYVGVINLLEFVI